MFNTAKNFFCCHQEAMVSNLFTLKVVVTFFMIFISYMYFMVSKQETPKIQSILKKRGLSFSQTDREFKTVRFNSDVQIINAISYNRAIGKPWKLITLREKLNIMTELDNYKRLEMYVHEDSKSLTRYHTPPRVNLAKHTRSAILRKLPTSVNQ